MRQIERNEISYMARAKKDSMFQREFDRHLAAVQKICQFDVEIESLGIFNNLANCMLSLAAMRSMSAGYSGSHDDGGAGRIVQELAGILCGARMVQDGVIIGEYKKLVDTMQMESDPEFAKYKELHAKFGGIAP